MYKRPTAFLQKEEYSANVLISIYIATRDGLEKFQIIIQIVLVWLVPFFAAIGIWLFYRSQDRPSDRRKLEGNGHDSVGASDSGGS